MVTITAIVEDPDGIDSVILYYRYDDTIVWNSTIMTNTVGTTYSTDIGPFEEGRTVQYYIEAVDSSYEMVSVIEDNGGIYYSFNITDSSTKTIGFGTMEVLLMMAGIMSLAVARIIIKRRK